MRFLFYMGHPAHYHNVKIVMDQLSERGHEIMVIGREKDVLMDLLKDVPYEKWFFAGKKNNSKFQLIKTVLNRQVRMMMIALKKRPDIMIGTDLVITHVGRLLGIPSIVLNEDDTNEIPLFTNYGIRFANVALSPVSCPGEPYEYKTFKYEGYHELAYLHPNYFTPDKSKVTSLLSESSPYFIIRFSALGSHHDVGRGGITDELALQIIEQLKPHGRIFITVEKEKEMSKVFDEYRISIDPKDIHHALYFADMYIGDSQTMAAEAAVLGTPALRFNDFVGRLGYLEELEHKYKLTFGVPTNEPEYLIEKVKEIAEDKESKIKWEERRKYMLSETIDVAAYWTDFFENYPESTKKEYVTKTI